MRADSLYRPHPGEVFTRRCLAKTSLKQDEVAKRVGISTKHLSRFINGHVHVGVELARKIRGLYQYQRECLAALPNSV